VASEQGLNKRRFLLGQKWTAQRVLENWHKQQVIEKVKEWNEGNYVIQDYQPTLNELLEGVALDKEAEARQLAEEWNATGGPGEVQTR